MREKFELVLARYAEGGTLLSALKAAQFRHADFYKFLADNPSDKARYYTVQESRADMMVDEAYEISTDDTKDHRRARVQAEIRLKIAATYDRARFGERVDVNVRGQVDMVAALAEAKARVLRPPRDPAQIIDAEYAVIAAPNAHVTPDTQANARLASADIVELNKSLTPSIFDE